jgi:hypothetical protein
MEPIQPVHEKKHCSQNGEDGVIDTIFKMIGTTTKAFVEIGVGTGLENNTHRLVSTGWHGAWFDIEKAHHVPLSVVFKQAKVSPDNVAELLYCVPRDLDLLSIDIDGHDYWVWKAILHMPRVVVIEYNGYLPPPISQTIPYDVNYKWKQTTYFGASLCALHKLAISKGYALVYCNHVNAFFVQAALAGGAALTPEQAFKPGKMNRPRDSRKMIDV